MAISDRPWGGFSEADYTPEQYCRAALIDQHDPGETRTKARCKLPVREPGGALNRNGVHAAAGRLAGAGGGVEATPDEKRAAARKLVSLYRELDEEPPDSIRRMAGG